MLRYVEADSEILDVPIKACEYRAFPFQQDAMSLATTVKLTMLSSIDLDSGAPISARQRREASLSFFGVSYPIEENENQTGDLVV